MKNEMNANRFTFGSVWLKLLHRSLYSLLAPSNDTAFHSQRDSAMTDYKHTVVTKRTSFLMRKACAVHEGVPKQFAQTRSCRTGTVCEQHGNRTIETNNRRFDAFEGIVNEIGVACEIEITWNQKQSVKQTPNTRCLNEFVGVCRCLSASVGKTRWATRIASQLLARES